MTNLEDQLTVQEFLREPSESDSLQPPPVELLVAKSVTRRRQKHMMFIAAALVPLLGVSGLLALRDPEPSQVASVEDLDPLSSETSVVLPAQQPDSDVVGLVVPTGDGGSAALCRNGEEVETYQLEPSSQSAFVGSPEQAVEAYLGSIRTQFSADNPDLQSVSDEARAAYIDYFDTYFGPAANLSAPETRREGELIVFVKPMESESEFGAFDWSSVRVELRPTSDGLYEVSSAAVCASQIYEEGALLNGPDLSSE